MSNSRTTSRFKRPSSISIPRDRLHSGIVLYRDLQECNNSLDNHRKIIDKLSKQVLGQENKIDRLNYEIITLNEKIREKQTFASDEYDLMESDFAKMWAMPRTRTGRGTRRGKKRKMRRSKRR